MSEWIHLVEDEPVRRFGRNNHSHTVLHGEAPAEPVVLGETEPKWGNHGGVQVQRIVSGYDVGENSTRRIAAMSDLERLVHEQLSDYSETMWRYEDSHQHGLTPVELAAGIDPWETFDTGDGPKYKAGPVKILTEVTDERTGITELKETDRIAHHKLRYQPLSNIEPNTAYDMVFEVMRREGILDEHNVLKEDSENRPTPHVFDYIQVLATLPIKPQNGTKEQEKEWEEALAQWIAQQERAIFHLSQVNSQEFDQLPTWWTDSVGGDDHDDVYWDGDPWHGSERVSTPRNHAIEMGPSRLLFVDHWPQGHPQEWILHMVVNLCRNSKDEFARLYEREADDHVSVHQKYLHDDCEVAFHLERAEEKEDEIELVRQRIAKAPGKELKALHELKTLLERELTDINRNVRFANSTLTTKESKQRYAEFDQEGNPLPEPVASEIFLFAQGDLIPWESQAAYCRWRLDNHRTLGKNPKKIRQNGQPVIQMMPLANAWPQLYIAMQELLDRALEVEDPTPGQQVNRKTGETWTELEQDVVKALEEVDKEYRQWRLDRFLPSVWYMNQQPVVQSLRDKFEECLDLAGDEVTEVKTRYRDEDGNIHTKVEKVITPEGRRILSEKTRLVRLPSGKVIRTSPIRKIGMLLRQQLYHNAKGCFRIQASMIKMPSGFKGDPIRYFKRMVAGQCWQEYEAFRLKYEQGFTLPCGTDLQHASVEEMRESPAFQAFGPRTAEALAKAIIWRRLSHWAWNPFKSKMEERQGIFYLTDLRNLPIIIEGTADACRLCNPSEEDEEVLQDRICTRKANPVTGRVKPGHEGHRVTMFAADHKDSNGRPQSAQLLRLTSQNPMELGSWVRDMRLAVRVNDRRKLAAVGRKLSAEKLLDKTDYQALWATYNVAKERLAQRQL